jgi:hypothetical protein
VTLIDSSAWVDYWRGVVSPVTDSLGQMLTDGTAETADLTLLEVLRGFGGRWCGCRATRS